MALRFPALGIRKMSIKDLVLYGSATYVHMHVQVLQGKFNSGVGCQLKVTVHADSSSSGEV